MRAGATLSQGLGASVLKDLRSGRTRRGLRNSWYRGHRAVDGSQSSWKTSHPPLLKAFWRERTRAWAEGLPNPATSETDSSTDLPEVYRWDLQMRCTESPRMMTEAKRKGDVWVGQRQAEAGLVGAEDHHRGVEVGRGPSLSLEEGNGVGNAGGRCVKIGGRIWCTAFTKCGHSFWGTWRDFGIVPF